MKKLYYLIAFVLLFVGCKDGGSPISAPSDVGNVSTKADTGAVVVSWDVPADSSFLYLNVSYLKYPNSPKSADSNKVITTKVSKYTDSVKVEGLLNKYEYAFTVQPYNANSEKTVSGKELESDPTRPISRPVSTVYYPDSLTAIEEAKIDTLIPISVDFKGQGPANLLDDDKSTFWQTSWYYTPAPTPHWLEIHFKEEVSIGAFKYMLRQTSDTRGFPVEFAIDTSAAGNQWTEVWASEKDLPISPVSSKFSLDFGRNYKAKYFRLKIMKNAGETNFSHLAELGLYNMKSVDTDLEDLAEDDY